MACFDQNRKPIPCPPGVPDGTILYSRNSVPSSQNLVPSSQDGNNTPQLSGQSFFPNTFANFDFQQNPQIPQTNYNLRNYMPNKYIDPMLDVPVDPNGNINPPANTNPFLNRFDQPGMQEKELYDATKKANSNPQSNYPSETKRKFGTPNYGAMLGFNALTTLGLGLSQRYDERRNQRGNIYSNLTANYGASNGVNYGYRKYGGTLKKYQKGGLANFCYDEKGNKIPCPQGVKNGTKVFDNPIKFKQAQQNYNDSLSLYSIVTNQLNKNKNVRPDWINTNTKAISNEEAFNKIKNSTERDFLKTENDRRKFLISPFNKDVEEYIYGQNLRGYRNLSGDKSLSNESLEGFRKMYSAKNSRYIEEIKKSKIQPINFRDSDGFIPVRGGDGNITVIKDGVMFPVYKKPTHPPVLKPKPLEMIIDGKKMSYDLDNYSSNQRENLNENLRLQKLGKPFSKDPLKLLPDLITINENGVDKVYDLSMYSTAGKKKLKAKANTITTSPATSQPTQESNVTQSTLPKPQIVPANIAESKVIIPQVSVPQKEVYIPPVKQQSYKNTGVYNRLYGAGKEAYDIVNLENGNVQLFDAWNKKLVGNPTTTDELNKTGTNTNIEQYKKLFGLQKQKYGGSLKKFENGGSMDEDYDFLFGDEDSESDEKLTTDNVEQSLEAAEKQRLQTIAAEKLYKRQRRMNNNNYINQDTEYRNEYQIDAPYSPTTTNSYNYTDSIPNPAVNTASDTGGNYITAQVTRYGMVGDPNQNHKATVNGSKHENLGNRNNLLEDGVSVALSPEFAKQLGINLKTGEFVEANINGKWEKFRVDDQTASGLRNNRIDFYDPNGRRKAIDGNMVQVRKAKMEQGGIVKDLSPSELINMYKKGIKFKIL